MTATVRAAQVGILAAAGVPVQDKPLMLVTALTVRFGEFWALRDVSLSLAPRGVHAVIGPNGAGKSTLFNAISGFVRPTSGRIQFADTDVTGWRTDRLARSGLARSFQISAVFPELSVEDNLRMALNRNVTGLGVLRLRSGDELGARAEDLLVETGLARLRGHRAADLSYGHRRLLELATTLVLQPKAMLLDEPIAGLARGDVPEVTAMIARAAESCAVLLIEHNLQVVERLADDVTVLAGGRILSRGGYRAVAADQRVREAYLGEAAHG